MIPQMIKMGYPRLFAVNVTISGSLQPLLVPPSHNMIIYSIAAGGTFWSPICSCLESFQRYWAARWSSLLCAMRAAQFPQASKSCSANRKIARRRLGHGHHRYILGASVRRVYTDQSGAVACVYAFLDDVRLSRRQRSEILKLDRPCHPHSGHGHDHDRIFDFVRLHDGALQGADRNEILHRYFQRQVHATLLWINILLLLLGTSHGSGADAFRSARRYSCR
jgi:hypothetical protein